MRLGVLIGAGAVVVAGALGVPPALAADDDDYVLPGPGASMLAVPPAGPLGPGAPDGELSAMRTERSYRYAISVVSIPLKGYRLGAGKSAVGKMIDRVGARMSTQTDGLISYGFHSWRRAPRTTDRSLPCSVEKLHRRYGDYAPGLDRTPPGYSDTIALYITPVRYRCDFAGLAVLGGDATYLNGLDLRDPERLQDWITAHEFGHNLTLVHSGAFFPTEPGWRLGVDPIPQQAQAQELREYGDYLDVMGSPPKGGFDISGSDFADWVLDGVSLTNIGVLGDSDVAKVRRSRTYELAALSPSGDPRRPSLLAIPVMSDGVPSFWVLEYRPLSQNAASGLDYPQPWLGQGYGVRLILFEHFDRDYYHINKVWRAARKPASLSHLPVGKRVPLGGGTSVTVNATGPTTASVSITIPGSVAQQVDWPSAGRVARLGPGRGLQLSPATDQGSRITWDVRSGKSCSVDRYGRGRHQLAYLVKSQRHGRCDIRATAAKVPFAFLAAYRETAAYVFTRNEVSRHFRS